MKASILEEAGFTPEERGEEKEVGRESSQELGVVTRMDGGEGGALHNYLYVHRICYC